MSDVIDRGYELDHRYTRTQGRVFLTGIQALVRLPLEQRRLDRTLGRRTAGFVSGYRGSPLAGLDQALLAAQPHLDAADVRFQPAINEALAATAILGSQQVESEPNARVDGVFAMWYGKGPGVDWAGDAIKHGNAYGSSPHGGVLVVAGDDHGAVSSTMSHQSDQALAAWYLPVVHPADVGELLELGLYGWALSRFTGAWVGLKAIAETVESATTLELRPRLPAFVTPDDFTPPPGGLHFRWVDPPSQAIEQRLMAKLAAAEAFARANSPDRLILANDAAWLGIVTVGKAHHDLIEALAALGFAGERRLAELGLRILKLGQTFPIEGQGLRRFARGLETLLVVEEKRPFVEDQIAKLLYPLATAARPRLLGKTDGRGGALLPAWGELRPHTLAPVLADLLRARHPELALEHRLRQLATAEMPGEAPRRTPYFCSGCPHNSSTRVPEGATAMAGIGCHIMATWMPDRPTAGITQMGGEGANWTGLAPFTTTGHVFQNLGDGTFYHSGQLAIRQAVAAGQPITFKILFNDAVAMTGGQKMETGRLTVPQITRQVRDEGVERIAVVSDEPERYRGIRDLAPGTTIHHRRELDAVQRELQAIAAVTVLVYDQTCAAEKRRRRKAKAMIDPPRRAFINHLVCEACGDCSRASNCVSIVPRETALGTKRQVEQSSCNKDFSCVDGFCPSFVTVEGAELRKPNGLDLADPAVAARLDALPEPGIGRLTAAGDILVTGIGGTGVLTIGAIIGMAAHLEGRKASVLDFTGLAQKGGAVLSHVRIAGPDPMSAPQAARIAPGTASLVLACDLVTAAGRDALATMRAGRTAVIGNAHLQPTAEFVHDRDFALDRAMLRRRLERAAGTDAVTLIDAHALALAVTGDAIGANMLLLGAAWQAGQVPVSRAALMRAIELNGVAVAANQAAFAWGRLAQAAPELLAGLVHGDAEAEPGTLDALIGQRRAELARYQDEAYAQRYESRVRRVATIERALLGDGSLPLTEAVARNLFRLMAYKDEYEVARLYTDGRFARELEATFAAGGTVKVHLAPPLLAPRDRATGRPRKLAFGPWVLRAMRPLARLRRLRGTAFDPFGWTAERRHERRLRDEYEALVDRLVADLDLANHGLAVELARLPDRVRGFGHVKLAALDGYEAERARLLERFASTPPVALPIAAE